MKADNFYSFQATVFLSTEENYAISQSKMP